jgi:predicted RNase H-like HicB family nuclease
MSIWRMSRYGETSTQPARNYPVTIFYSEEDGGYIAIASDHKGCSAFGETPQQVLRELEVAMDLWLEVAHRDSAPIPEPTRICA